MTRHARNCTAGAVYTYHEKKKDAEASGYGTQNQRVGKDSVKNFDCCCLTLQPCRDPVITHRVVKCDYQEQGGLLVILETTEEEQTLKKHLVYHGQYLKTYKIIMYYPLNGKKK